jgi:hypothetical protein
MVNVIIMSVILMIAVMPSVIVQNVFMLTVVLCEVSYRQILECSYLLKNPI